ncbi:MAG: hypothetical protein F4029_03425 [Gammaproteobacteria bacterium]|nr:hypothetical protein [Gammaproteobacteria bacterium]MXY58384.1 hypothetical protein [Gammaproteobacteria bacterium]MYF27848.1 hypothetical protein [Gammaproteobacteria bacterium]MYK45260.1 hypothetical protein [Gammaproteobacteria bacterium]
MPYRWSLVFGIAFLLPACTSLDPDVPRGFDLSGDWMLDRDASDAPPDVDAIRRREDRDVIRGRQSDAAASAAFAVQDFPVLTATRLEIEQDDESMGIRYDGTLYRDISWGKRERDLWRVHAGWNEGDLVIRSVRGRTKGSETLALERNGMLLRVTVSIETGGQDVRSVRVYRRR